MDETALAQALRMAVQRHIMGCGPVTWEQSWTAVEEQIRLVIRDEIARAASSSPAFDSVIVHKGSPEAGPNLDGLFSSASGDQ